MTRMYRLTVSITVVAAIGCFFAAPAPAQPFVATASVASDVCTDPNQGSCMRGTLYVVNGATHQVQSSAVIWQGEAVHTGQKLLVHPGGTFAYAAHNSGISPAITRLITVIDLYPTLVALAGVTAPSGLQGRSLIPLLKDPNARWDHAALSQVRRSANPNTGATTPFMGYSVRTAEWRYTEWEAGARGVELYNERADPDERRNLASDPKHQPQVAEMRKLLRRMIGQ